MGRVTAPLTPHEQPPQYPKYPGGDADSDAVHGGPGPIGAEILHAALVTVLVAACGIVLGLLWLWLAPRVPMISDGTAVYLKDTEGEEAIGGDGTYAIIAAVLGVVTAAIAFWRYRGGGVGIVVGLAVGGFLGSLIGWRFGYDLGPMHDIAAHARKVGPDKVFDGPLKLRATSALVVWPAAAMLAHLCLTAAFGPRELPPPVPTWAPPPPPPPAPAAPAAPPE